MTTAEHAPPPSVDASIATLVERIAERVEPIQVWLFGSQARGDAHEWSDVDLLVVLDHAADRRACRVQINGLLSDVPIGADIFFTTAEQIVRRGRVAGTLLSNALEEGRLIYEQEDPYEATALEWLDTARLDLLMAERTIAQMDEEPGLAGPISWHAQQALEKSIKAALFLERIRVPRTHELEDLAELLPEAMREWTKGMNLNSLTYRGLGGRYPDYGPNPTPDEARQALSDARELYNQVTAEFQRRGITPE